MLACMAAIVLDAVVTQWQRDNALMSVVALVAAPFTLLIWPVFGTGADLVGIPLWQILIALFVAYPISTFIGGMLPIDAPGQMLSPAAYIPQRKLEAMIAAPQATYYEHDASDDDGLDVPAAPTPT